MNQEEFQKRYTFSPRADRLGGGAFGTVYKAYDNNNNQFLAMKVAEVKNINGKEFSLLDEFEAIGNLPSHPNIANYYEVHTFEQSNGVYDYALIQYYPHGNLSDLIRNESLKKEEKEDIALQILDGLDFLHRHQVVHRDMKPSNVLMHKHDITGRFIPKIADFGLSKRAEIEKQSRFDNSFGGGTLEYSSPEQLRGQELRFNTDLWAWAVMVYELFTGKSLFMGNNQGTGSAERDKDLFENIIKKDVFAELSVLDEKWQNVLGKCLVRDSNERIKSAQEIKDILEINNSSAVTQNPKAAIQEAATVIRPKEKEEPQPIEKPIKVEPRQEITQNIPSDNVPHSKEKKGFNSKYLVFGILGLLILGTGIWFFGFKNSGHAASSTQASDASPLNYDTAKNIFQQLHDIQMSGNISDLQEIIAKNVTKYYNSENITFKDVLDKVVDYNKKWKQESVEILSFKENGNNKYSYEIKYDYKKIGETEVRSQNITGIVGYTYDEGKYKINYLEESNRLVQSPDANIEYKSSKQFIAEDVDAEIAQYINQAINSYFVCDESRDLNCILDHFQYPVKRYFNDKNLSEEQLKNMYLKSYSEVAYEHNHSIDWDNGVLYGRQNGNYYIKIKGIYNYQTVDTREWKKFSFDNTIVLNEDFKIVSYYANK